MGNATRASPASGASWPQGGQRCVRRMPGRSRGAVYRYRRDRTDAGWKEASRDRLPAVSRRSPSICGGLAPGSTPVTRAVQPAAGPVKARCRAPPEHGRGNAMARRAYILIGLCDGLRRFGADIALNWGIVRRPGPGVRPRQSRRRGRLRRCPPRLQASPHLCRDGLTKTDS